MGFQYSDGREVEETILRYLGEHPELGSGAWIAEHEQERCWPVRYHLAPARANLVRHLDFSGLDVLELGAGMGGLSRYLAERAGSLLAVEGSARRFAALERRLHDLDGWEGRCCRIEELVTERRFDVVCLVGVLEYAELHVERPEGFDGDVFDFLLARSAEFLRPGGVLLLAIENRLGLKYWSGVGEDHTGGLFDGIAGYPATPTARTFARRELQGRLRRAELEVGAEYLPFPDYKLPTSVLCPELAERDPDLAADLACFHEFTDPLRPRSVLFPDYLALSGVSRAGLFAEFANSFLFAACRDGASPLLDRLTRDPGGSGREIAWHYSPGRRFPTLTTFTVAEEGEGLLVEKRRLGEPEGPAEVSLGDRGKLDVLWRPAHRQPVVRGERLRERLLRHGYFGQGEAFVEGCRHFVAWAAERFAGARPGRLRGEALDALITNAVVDGDGYRLFDHEWSVRGDQPVSWFVLRNLLALRSDLSALNRGLGFASLAELYQLLCRRLDVDAELEGDLRREARFQSLVSPTTEERKAVDLRALVDRRLTARGLPPRHPGFERELAGDDGAGGGGRGFAATVSSQQRSLEDQSLALAEQQRAITTQTEAVRRLQDTIRRLEEAVVSQQRTVEAQQENLAGAREELARRVDELRAEWKRADGAEAAARSAAATVEELRRRLEERSRELDESRRRAGELTAVLESRRHRLVEGPYRWLKRRPRLFSLFKWSWRGALKASGRR